ncbi:acyl-CoA N-acyltransferase, partial [Leucogyrophana mollusca]
QVHDLIQIQACGLRNLPDTDVMQSWMSCIVSWSGISAVAEDSEGRIVGYVLARIKDAADSEGGIHGHIRSISVLRSHRRRGLARKLMSLSLRAMQDTYRATHVTLHVRKSNVGARALYAGLGFTCVKVKERHCESLQVLRCWFSLKYT